MSIFYLDASALVKRYVLEVGTLWIQALTHPNAGHTIVIAEITMVEAAAAFAAKHRAPNGITLQERDDAVNLLLSHCGAEYQLISISRAVLDRAVLLTQVHRLRGYDAVQLATAIVVNKQYVAANFAPVTLIAADSDLLSAAQNEGLSVDNPLAHP